MTIKPSLIKWALKPIVHLLALFPFMLLVYGFFTNKLGFNPVEELTHQTGTWALRLLLISLFITPIRMMTKQHWVTQFRRMLGLYAFFYTLCHFMVYFVWDQGLTLKYVVEDVIDRPYISVGFAALVVLLILTLTSTNKIRRKMKRNWSRLHKLVYLAGVGAVLHFLWLTKADYREPFIYLGLFITLMLFRLYSANKTYRNKSRNKKLKPL